ncbi:hypothetical protein ATER59S_00527 [Aquamicrobium terrae]
MKRHHAIANRILEGSLASKLLTLRPGETFYLDDLRDGPKATPLDRMVQSVAAKTNALKDRRFTTQGWIAVQVSQVQAKRILAIRRIDLWNDQMP